MTAAVEAREIRRMKGAVVARELVVDWVVGLEAYRAEDYGLWGHDTGCMVQEDHLGKQAVGSHLAGRTGWEGTAAAGTDPAVGTVLAANMPVDHCMAVGEQPRAVCKVLVSIDRNSHLVVDHMKLAEQYKETHSAGGKLLP